MTGRLPLHVLTGFLGSGKTTLLNRLLRDPELADSAVLISEFGSISIDHHVVQRFEQADGIDVAVLDGGCTCCTVRGDLVAALRELYSRRADGRLPAFQRVVLETSGLADPAPVLFTLIADPILRHKFAAGVVVTTVDAVHGSAQLSQYPESRKQVAAADRLVVTKTDLAGADAAVKLRRRLGAMNPAAAIRDGQALPSLQELLAGPAATLAMDGNEAISSEALSASGFRCEAVADHTPDLRTAAMVLDEPIDWPAFAVWLSLFVHAHGARVLRFKAILNVADWPGPVVLNGVHHLIHPPIHLPSWAPGGRLSRLVFIARDLDMSGIERSLRRFLAATRQSEGAAGVA